MMANVSNTVRNCRRDTIATPLSFAAVSVFHFFIMCEVAWKKMQSKNLIIVNRPIPLGTDCGKPTTLLRWATHVAIYSLISPTASSTAARMEPSRTISVTISISGCSGRSSINRFSFLRMTLYAA